MAEFHLDYEGGGEVLKSDEVAAWVNSVGQAIADDIGEDAFIDDYVTDRAVTAVTVYARRQITDGALTKAAASQGLEVHPL